MSRENVGRVKTIILPMLVYQLGQDIISGEIQKVNDGY